MYVLFDFIACAVFQRLRLKFQNCIVNTPYRFEQIYGNSAYILEDEDAEGHAIYCGWQNEYHPESRICDFYLSLFEENGEGSYERSEEHQQERCYTMEDLTAMLKESGFELLAVVADPEEHTPAEQTERWYFVARAIKERI